VRILASLLHDPTPSNILAECGWQELAERFASYRLELHPEKTRLLQYKAASMFPRSRQLASDKYAKDPHAGRDFADESAITQSIMYWLTGSVGMLVEKGKGVII
jgi:hypothetical protein